ncbi:MAG: hypothetical protein HY862_09235 [Chloroflexi bacterium]|nr:hypothetical protein [Chloroflexota bacterium]
MSKVSQILVFGLLFAILIPTVAAQQDDAGPTFLVAGVDLNGEGYPVTRVNLADGSENTLVTFASRPVCTPSVFQNGTGLIYEMVEAQPPENVYRVNTQTGVRETLNAVEALNCPVVSPAGDKIAWLRNNPDSQTLVITDMQGVVLMELITHPNIYDVEWSPGGSALIYNVTSDESPFPALYSIPVEIGAEPRAFWSRYLGLADEYEWIPDGSGVLVAYHTEDNAALTVLSTDCVIGLGPACETEPLATFSGEDSLDLLGDYSPIVQETVIGVQSEDLEGNLITDLWVIDLLGIAPARQLTNTPDITETDAYWASNGLALYFIGSQFDAEAGTLVGGIYSIPADGSAPASLRFISPVFSPGAILWVYE